MTAVAIRAPAETVAAVLKALRAGLEPLRTVAPLTLSDWAASTPFKLSAESSHQTGAWAAYPFQPGWMDAMSNDAIVEVTVRKSKRVGYTKTLLAFIAYNIHHRRRKQGIWQPTDDDRDSFVKSELDPMLRDMPKVGALQVGEDTMKLKSFLGSVLHLLGAKAARAFRRITLDVATLDEVDAMDMQVEKTVDPITGARGRLEGAAYPKLVAGSTPRRKGQSHVEYREANANAVMRYQITCPHCELEHPLAWGGKDIAHGFKWDAGGSNVRHLCQHCHKPITQADYLGADHQGLWSRGAWVSDCGRYRYGQDKAWRDEHGALCRPPSHVAFVIWAAYSPQRAWADIVREFLESKAKASAGDSAPLETFVNETLGELWEEKHERSDEHALQRRAEPYRLTTVPIGGLVVVAGVDTQDDRWEVAKWAIGRGEEMWLVDYAVIYGNPADQREWDTKLDPYLLQPLTHQAGRALTLRAAAVDTGGHFTHQAYQFCRAREQRRVFAVRGDPQPSKMIKGRATLQDVNARGKIIKKGVRLWYVGTDAAKDLLHGRLSVATPGPGFVHFSQDLPAVFYKGLTAESRVKAKTAVGEVYRWVNTHRRRNEPLDTTVYALWCTHQLGLHLYTSRAWLKLEIEVQPPTGDLFALTDAAPVPITADIASEATASPISIPQPIEPITLAAEAASAELMPAQPAQPVQTPAQVPPRPKKRVGRMMAPGWR